MSRRTRVIGLAVALIVVLGVIAVVLSRKPATRPGFSSDAPVDVSGTHLAVLGSGNDPDVGKLAPTAVGFDFDGHRRSIAVDGKPKVVMFIAHWCPHCQREVAAFSAYHETHSLPAGVEFISVSTFVDETRGNFPPSTWLEDARWPFTVIVDDASSELARAYGLSGTPFWTFIDAKGRVIRRASGEIAPQQIAAIMTSMKNGAFK
jgi:thiol-disulfide isomerase/thioredoxin